MKTSQDTGAERSVAVRAGTSRGFTLLDVLVALAVIAILMTMLMPTLGLVRETTRKIVCASNIRQLGLSMAMYAEDHRQQLPYSRYYRKSLSDPAFDTRQLMTVRVPLNPSFDGLGLLHAHDYGVVPAVYYCPSHQGMNRPDVYASAWGDVPAMLVSNFQFRGGARNGQTRLDRVDPRLSLIADGLASQADFNHTTGGNVLSADLSTAWFDDASGRLFRTLPNMSSEDGSRVKLQAAWGILDEAAGIADSNDPNSTIIQPDQGSTRR